jgi:Methyltransferase domain
MSCVVDEHPRFHLEALRWYASLTGVAGVHPSDLIVHATGSGPSEVLDLLAARGVEVRRIEPFDARSAHCNKIAGALCLADDIADGTIVLCDADTVILEDPRALAPRPGSVLGKLVDYPVPSLEALERVFATAGVPRPPLAPLPWRPGAATVMGNFNGGLYVLDGSSLPGVAAAWARWARWLLDRRELLGDEGTYVDQVAMALSLAEAGVETVALDARWNVPIHDPTNFPADGEVPAVLHYHQEVDRRGMIKPIGVPSVDQAIERVNVAFRVLWDEGPTPDTYREWLALSGLRPDSEAAAGGTRSAVASSLRYLRPASALTVGSTGVATGADGWPEQNLQFGNLEDALSRFRADPQLRVEVAVCLGPLAHQPDADTYHEGLRLLWGSANRALLVSGREETPDLDDVTYQFHEPLSVSLSRLAPEAERYKIDAAAPMATYLVLRRPDQAHPRDFTSSTLDGLADRHPDLLGLATLRLHARGSTTFYPDHAPRLWEYPVVGRVLTDRLPPGSRLVDVGAGVTPLAPFLTDLGYSVDTVDPSATRRAWPPQPDWNEWDFLDYGRAGLAHQSWNRTLDQLPRRLRFDGAYSISVIEHVKADDRRRLLREMAARVASGGLVVVTIDLVRGTDDLWNKNLGVEVEDASVHGTFDDVVREAAAVGLDLIRRETVREWGDVAVDIGLAAFLKTSEPPPIRRLGRLRLPARVGRRRRATRV